VIDLLQPMLTLTDPQNGVVSFRKASFDANDIAKSASDKAAAAVRAIAASSAGIAASAKDSIYESTAGLTAEVAAARERMQQIGLASVAFALLAPLMIWKMVTSPLSDVTPVPARLAEGEVGGC